MDSEVTDRKLIDGYLAGNSACFDQLYERYRRPLYSFLNGMLPGQPDIADDLYQKTWIKVINNLGRYHEKSTFLSWLLRIARNNAIDHFRREKKNVHENIEDHAIAGRDEPWHRLHRQELAVAVQEAIGKLAEEQREVFLLRQEGVSFRDIAEISHCSVNTALGRMHYAVRKLRSLLRDWKPEPNTTAEYA